MDDASLAAALAAARAIATDKWFYVEARVGSANHRNRPGDEPCRAVWNGARRNEPADALIRQLAAAVVQLEQQRAAAKRPPEEKA
jgi:hypothetical protein